MPQSKITLSFNVTQGDPAVLADWLARCVNDTNLCSIAEYARRTGIVIDRHSVDVRLAEHSPGE